MDALSQFRNNWFVRNEEAPTLDDAEAAFVRAPRWAPPRNAGTARRTTPAWPRCWSSIRTCCSGSESACSSSPSASAAAAPPSSCCSPTASPSSWTSAPTTSCTKPPGQAPRTRCGRCSSPASRMPPASPSRSPTSAGRTTSRSCTGPPRAASRKWPNCSFGTASASTTPCRSRATASAATRPCTKPPRHPAWPRDTTRACRSLVCSSPTERPTTSTRRAAWTTPSGYKNSSLPTLPSSAPRTPTA